MTAGQRNCYIAIQECLGRYSLDDVLFAVRENIVEKRDKATDSNERKILTGADTSIAYIRRRLASIEVKAQ